MAKQKPLPWVIITTHWQDQDKPHGVVIPSAKFVIHIELLDLAKVKVGPFKVNVRS